ncbi:hypothetical protein [Paraburkholderia sp. BL10I2N1]|uniref:hypothetical protein n=1 Tax=Paraburkholderia sp. BL10I2N1 TaxID=1938796 RepID=UPI001414EFD4
MKYVSRGKRVVYDPLSGAEPCHERLGFRREGPMIVCYQAYRRNRRSTSANHFDLHDGDKTTRWQQCNVARRFPHWFKLHRDLEAPVRIDSFHLSI